MKELIEIYELKLKNINERIQEFKDDESWSTITERQRLTIKKMEYKAFLDDLRRVCPVEEKELLKPIYMENKISYCLLKRVNIDRIPFNRDSTDYYYIRITSDWSKIPTWSMGYVNSHGSISLVGGDLSEDLLNELEKEYKEYI